MDRAGPSRRARMGVLWLILFGALFEGWIALAPVTAQEGAPATTTPRRRIRRRYDGAVQIHAPSEPPPAAPTETQKGLRAEPRTDLGAADKLTPSAPPPVMPPPPMRIRLQQSEAEKKDDLWITLPAGTLLGVNLQSTNGVGVESWGWLADSINNTRSAQQAERERTETPDEEEEGEDENPARELRMGIIEPMDASRAVMAQTSVEPNSRFEPRLFAQEGVRTSDRVSGFPALRTEENTERPGSRVFGSEATRSVEPPLTPSFPGASGRIEEIAEAHRPRPVTPASVDTGRDALGKPLNAATAPSPAWGVSVFSAPAASRPMMYGSAENYGRRGDIFSSSFQSSSADLPGSRASGVSSSTPSLMPSFPMPLAPANPALSDRPRPIPDSREIMRPFDPAGRPLTDIDRRR